MSAAKIVVLVALALSLIAIGVISTLTPPTHWQGSLSSFRSPLIMSTVTAITTLAAAVLFIMSLDAYKEQLRAAYTAIAIGITVAALGTVQLPFLDIFNLMTSWWITTGAVALPFLLSGAAVYIGARRFARLVAIKTALVRARVVLPGVFVLLVASSLLPHAPAPSPEATFDSSNIIILWTGLLFLIAAIITLKVGTHIGAHYKAAVGWLGLGLMCSTSAIVFTLLGLYTTGATTAYDNAIDLATTGAGFVYIVAGYLFYKTRDV